MRYKLTFRDKMYHEQAFKDLKEWGYPWGRDEYGPIALIEICPAAGWIWFDWIDDKWASVHICIAPSHKGRVISKHTLRALYYACDFMGVERMYTGETEGEIASYVERLGWKKDDIGWYYDGQSS